MAEFKSKISAIAASQLGKLQGQLETRLLVEAQVLLKKILEDCNNAPELLKALNTLNSLLAVIGKFEDKVSKFAKMTDSLIPILKLIKTVINVIKKLPIPTAVLGVGIPVNIPVNLADKLAMLSRVLESIESDIAALSALVKSVEPPIVKARITLQSININVATCIDAIEDEESKLLILSELTNITNQYGKDITTNDAVDVNYITDNNFPFRSASGRDYKLSIIEVSDASSVPKRRAVAKDNIGVIVLQGEASFSSSTEILLDELKFRINNKLN